MKIDYLARFWASVVKTRRCWVWVGKKMPGKDYGIFRDRYGAYGAHRFSWQLVNGRIPDGMNVLHSCDNPACVRPSHLFLGTQADNVRDCVSKGRQRGGKPRDAVRQVRLRQIEMALPRRMVTLVERIGQREADYLAATFGRYGIGQITQADIARRDGISRERVRQICERAIEKLLAA